MKTLLVIGLIVCASTAAQAAVLTCSDERDKSYEVKRDVAQGRIEVFASGSLIDSEKGSFKNCAVVGADRGAILDQEECEFIRVGGKSLGTITIREDGSGYYNMDLADRNFRGWCQ